MHHGAKEVLEGAIDFASPLLLGGRVRSLSAHIKDIAPTVTISTRESGDDDCCAAEEMSTEHRSTIDDRRSTP